MQHSSKYGASRGASPLALATLGLHAPRGPTSSGSRPRSSGWSAAPQRLARSRSGRSGCCPTAAATRRRPWSSSASAGGAEPHGRTDADGGQVLEVRSGQCHAVLLQDTADWSGVGPSLAVVWPKLNRSRPSLFDQTWTVQFPGVSVPVSFCCRCRRLCLFVCLFLSGFVIGVHWGRGVPLRRIARGSTSRTWLLVWSCWWFCSWAKGGGQQWPFALDAQTGSRGARACVGVCGRAGACVGGRARTCAGAPSFRARARRVR